ncbi:MAG: hypothetical protein JNL39_16310 [Opitutaceae bacterium]|nr:hypothetical protein [Opitutaceae bacterium]
MRLVPMLLSLALPALGPAVRAADSAKPEKIPKEERREMKRAGDAPSKDDRPRSSDMQARISSRLRERLEVTDDAEWAVISERITRVEELRRATAAGPLAAIDRAKRSARGESAGTEREALRSAVTDRLPDAEIRSRLARLGEAQKREAAKLAQAQEDLRAVLTVRQEAIAVMLGLLSP